MMANNKVCTTSSPPIKIITFILLLSLNYYNVEARSGDILSPLQAALFPSSPNFTLYEESEGENQLCNNYTRLYMQELKRFTLWAAQMYDSTAKVPDGILTGNTYQFGSYDSCVDIDVQLQEQGGGFRGKYCLARVQFAPLVSTYPSYYIPSEDPYRMKFEANGSAWEKIKYTGDKRKIRRDVIHWGVCVPSVCSSSDVIVAVESALRPLEAHLGMRATVSLPEEMCNTKTTPRKLAAGDFTFMTVVSVIVLTVLSCTLIEVLGKDGKGVLSNVIKAFSIRTNWFALVRGPASREAEAGDLRCIHGLRIFSMLLIILGHRSMFTFGGPMHNPQRVEEIYTSAMNMLLLNGTIIVDTFFVISGFLSCYLMLLELDKKKKINVPMLYLYRYIRLTPVYAIVVAYFATVIDQLGEGPLWASKVGIERQRCRDNWWTNMLYINNYINPKHMCMFQSWFLACDMHYFLVAPLVVLSLWRWPRAGKALLVGATMLAVAIPFAVTLLGGLDAVLLLFTSTLADPVANETFRSIYIPSHTRAGPYFLGMLWGYVFYKIRTSGTKISKRFGAFLWVLLHFVALACLFGAWAFYLPGVEYSPLEKALYGGLHRAGWGIAMGWLIIACALGLSGPYRALLSWKPLVPFSRLTYCAFLVHGGVQLYQAATMRNPEFISYYKLFWMTSGDVVVTFGIAFVIHMLFEAPVSALEKAFIRKGSQSPESSRETLPTTNANACQLTWNKDNTTH